jgi:photosystem II stability/assembly factor-like uncharacterized protein
MNRRIRLAALIAVVLIFPVVGSCQALSKSASSTPVASAGKVPVLANPGPVQTNLAKCAIGAQNEPLDDFALKMTSSMTGWALGQCTLGARPSFSNGSTVNCMWPQIESMGILRTSDGGTTWTDVSPPSVTNRTWHHAQFFLDANHAWVGEVSRTADACVSQVTMFMTADGGRSWEQGGTIPIKTEAPTDDVFNIGPTDYMDFVDPQHGWLMVVSPPTNPTLGSMVTQTTLYATADGGLHWRALGINPGSSAASGLPGCQGAGYMPASDVSFQSATTGWLAIDCPTIAMLTTRDGGATWSAKALPNCTCQVWRPESFDASHALITGEQGSPVMLWTADAGATWTQRRVPHAAMTEFSFTSPNDGWMVGIAQLAKSYETVVYRTADGGQTWSLLGKPGFATPASNPNAYFPVVGVQFVNANAGFVVLGAEAVQNGQSDPSAPQLQVLSTGDGGRTWSVVLKQVPAVPCTASYHQLGNGSINLWPTKLASSTTAWAQGGLRTTDGGAHWRDVSAPALREGSATPLYPPGYTEFFLDGDHAWQAGIYGSKVTCSDHLSTFATADGGKTWQPSSPVALNLPSGFRAGAVQLGFTSAQVGWLWTPMFPATGDPFGAPATDAYLDATTDGGLSWNRVTELSSSQLQHIPVPSGSQNCKPSLGQITFSSSTVGFLSLNCADPGMLVTHDGGATWKTQSLVPADCQCSPSLPTFVDATHGFMETYGGKSGGAGLLATSDGGATWRALPPMPSSGFIMAMTYADASNLWALVTPPGWTKISGGKDSLYRSSDGGQTWSLVQDGVPLGRVDSLLFAGGAGMVAQPRNATWSYDTAGFATANDTVLAVTTDGGHTWKVFAPAIST